MRFGTIMEDTSYTTRKNKNFQLRENQLDQRMGIKTFLLLQGVTTMMKKEELLLILPSSALLKIYS